jgi:hypothetical protein
MVTVKGVQKLALSFEEAVELPHFDLISFRVRKKIFATLDTDKNRACLFLSKVDQSVFSDLNKSAIYPVPNKWGEKGATYFELKKVRMDLFKDALTLSYCRVAPKKYCLNLDSIHRHLRTG